MIYYPQINNCSRCRGTGYIGRFRHIFSGICFECEGDHNYVTGVSKPKWFRHKKQPRLLKIDFTQFYSDYVGFGKMTPEIFEGVAHLDDEGFDEEILGDYVHQMSKRDSYDKAC
ncbi:hypothetical protein [Vibrio campbellii]|uniref:hypothetical protein n=1 Tax=Vibrio campbellii TaxID=680 RepID=UPI000CD3668E|nr:hypothetical protein [Vibrio campbellii]AUW07495.1 hypothetical protein C1N51_28145 [Vibrio campbellii]